MNLVTNSLLKLLIIANNKSQNDICIFVLGSNALVIALLNLTYFHLAQLSYFNRTLKLNWTLLTLFAYKSINISQIAFLYFPYAYLLLLMLHDLS